MYINTSKIFPTTNNFCKLSSKPLAENSSKSAKHDLLFLETSDRNDFYAYSIEKVLCHKKTAFQDVLIAELKSYGTSLMLDGAIQSTQSDESLYHEMLVHPAMLAHPNPKTALVLGGGEGATARELLKHDSIESIVMVDIDEELVQLCKKHMPTFHKGSFTDPRVKLVYADAVQFLKSEASKYDIIIVDLIDAFHDETNPPLYTVQFYKNLKAHLKPGGIIAVQGMEMGFIPTDEHFTLSRTIRKVFKYADSYQAFIPSFLSCWGYILASDKFQPAKWKPELILKEMQRLHGKPLEHLSPTALSAAFQLTKRTASLLSKEGTVWTEAGVSKTSKREI